MSDPRLVAALSEQWRCVCPDCGSTNIRISASVADSRSHSSTGDSGRHAYCDGCHKPVTGVYDRRAGRVVEVR